MSTKPFFAAYGVEVESEVGLNSAVCKCKLRGWPETLNFGKLGQCTTGVVFFVFKIGIGEPKKFATCQPPQNSANSNRFKKNFFLRFRCSASNKKITD